MLTVFSHTLSQGNGRTKLGSGCYADAAIRVNITNRNYLNRIHNLKNVKKFLFK
jgi:hypothetical protein